MRKFFAAAVLLTVSTQLQAQLVTPKAGAPQIVIPAAGAISGLGGTYFRSDTTLINYRTSNQKVRLNWLPQGVSGSGLAPVDITLAGGGALVSEDFVTTVLHQSGLGAILITAVAENGDFDNGGLLYATSRIWTPQPGANGTVSQTFPAISTLDTSQNAQTIIGQRRDDRYRTNVGIVNLSFTTVQTYRITAFGGSTTLVGATIQPYSMQQVAMTGPASPFLRILVENITNDLHGSFVTYGSSVDNITGDAWSSLGFVAAQ